MLPDEPGEVGQLLESRSLRAELVLEEPQDLVGVGLVHRLDDEVAL